MWHGLVHSLKNIVCVVAPDCIGDVFTKDWGCIHQGLLRHSGGCCQEDVLVQFLHDMVLVLYDMFWI